MSEVPDAGRGRTWFAVDGRLEPIDYEGPSYSKLGDWVLDPFCGFGTTLVVAERLGRHGVGFETDAPRAAFAASRIREPSRAIHTIGDGAVATDGLPSSTAGLPGAAIVSATVGFSSDYPQSHRRDKRNDGSS
jgi:hypothetical protein